MLTDLPQQGTVLPANLRHQTDHFTIKGHWWLPHTDRRVAGELVYTESDMSLSLYGGLSDAIAESPIRTRPSESQFSVVYGESEDNVPITIVKPFLTHWVPDITSLDIRPGTPVGLRSSRLYCRAMLEGIHLSSEDEPFSHCRVDIPYLDAWLGISPFIMDWTDLPQRIRLDYSLPANDEFELANLGCQLRFVHSVALPSLPLGPSPAISHRTYLEVQPHESQSFKRILTYSSEVVDLLSIVYGGPLSSRRVTLHGHPDNHEPIALYYPRHILKIADYKPHDFLLRYADLRGSFRTVVGKWMNASAKQKRARRMLVSSERRPAKFIELRFLPLAHAAEILSNEAPQTTLVDSAEFRSIRDRMLSSVQDDLSEELKDSIKNSLKWANGRSLKYKLRSLLGDLGDETCQTFAADTERFIKGVVETRNHYTHYSTKAGRRILQGNELHWAIQKLALMLRILLLIRSGIPEETVKTAVRSHVRLAQERSVWCDVSEEGSVLSREIPGDPKLPNSSCV